MSATATAGSGKAALHHRWRSKDAMLVDLIVGTGNRCCLLTLDRSAPI
jgi:hypothetical protein